MTQTIIGDVVPFERRGRATGIVMTSFSVATWRVCLRACCLQTSGAGTPPSLALV